MKTGRWQPGGFFQVDNQIFSMGLSPRDLAVYCCIAMHSNRETGVAYPSRRTIAKECGIQKVETIDRAIKVLCAKECWKNGINTRLPAARPAIFTP